MPVGVGMMLSLVVFAASNGKAESASHASLQQKDGVEWAIRPDGLGRQRGSGPPTFMPELRTLYPEARVSLEGGFPDGRRGVSRALYFVFRVNGEELFRTGCRCRRGLNGELTFDKWNTWSEGEASVWVRPIAVDARFKTERGIGVGSRVRDLLRAYKEYSPLYYFSSFVDSHQGADVEYACFLASRGTGRARRGTVEMMRFYVRPAEGKMFAGGNGRTDSDGVRNVDPDGVIIGIEPNVPCSPGHVDVEG